MANRPSGHRKALSIERIPLQTSRK
jgi:hypothetical protein